MITAHIANSNVHWLMVDNRSVVDILYLDGYKRVGLTKDNLIPTTSLLYGFIGNHIIPKGRTKLTVTLGELPRA